MRLLTLMIALAVTSTAFAQEPAAINATEVVSFANYSDGTHYLSITIVGGKITAIGTLRITVLPAPTEAPTDPTDPTDPEDPTDPLVVKVAALVASAPAVVKERTAMSKLFDSMAKLELTDPSEIIQATTRLFSLLPMSDGWEAWMEDAEEYAGSLASSADVKRAWLLISEGLK